MLLMSCSSWAIPLFPPAQETPDPWSIAWPWLEVGDEAAAPAVAVPKFPYTRLESVGLSHQTLARSSW